LEILAADVQVEPLCRGLRLSDGDLGPATRFLHASPPTPPEGGAPDYALSR